MATPRYAGPKGAPKQPPFGAKGAQTKKISGPQPAIPKAPKKAPAFAKKAPKPGMGR